MKIIHISRDRYEHIRSQGFHLGFVPEPDRYPAGDTEYHLLDGEVAHCETCNGEFESVKANDPAELDMAKRAA